MLVGLGIYYLGFKEADITRLKMFVDVPKTTYQVGEEILFEPYLIYQGSLPLLPVKIHSFLPLFFFLAYDMKGNLLNLPYPIRADLRLSHVLLSQIPFHNGKLRREYFKKQGLKPSYSLTLEKPGSYRIEFWAEFRLGSLLSKKEDSFRHHLPAEPILIEVK